jgi:hypothetical protein
MKTCRIKSSIPEQNTTKGGKGVKRSNTGYKGLADISTIQGFDLRPRFGHRTRIYLHMWVVRDSNPKMGYVLTWSTYG